MNRLRDHAREYVRAILASYGGMLSAQYVHVNLARNTVIVSPPQSQGFVMERIHMSVRIIFFQSVKHTLLRALEDEKLYKTVCMIVELLMLAENEPHVEMRLMSTETHWLLDLCRSTLETAEPPHMSQVADVPWLAAEVHGVVEPSSTTLRDKLMTRKLDLYTHFFQGPRPIEGPEAPMDAGAPASSRS